MALSAISLCVFTVGRAGVWFLATRRAAGLTNTRAALSDGAAFCFLLRPTAHCLGSPVAFRRGRMIDTGCRQLPVLHISDDNQERE
jgi:hypothetical protein